MKINAKTLEADARYARLKCANRCTNLMSVSKKTIQPIFCLS